MTVLLGEYAFGTDLGKMVYQIPQPQPAKFGQVEHTYWGLQGSLIHQSPIQSREIIIPATMLNHTNYQDIALFIDEVQSHVNDAGLLNVEGQAYENSTFEGWVPNGEIIFDASLQHGFVWQGALKFKQILQAASP